MNTKLYSLFMFALMQSPVFAMQQDRADRNAALRKEWNDAYNRYEYVATQDVKYYFLGFFIDPMLPREKRVIKSALSRCHVELTFQVYEKAEAKLRAAYFEMNGRDEPL